MCGFTNSGFALLIITGLILLGFLYLIVLRPLSGLKAIVVDYQKNKDSEKAALQLSRIRSRNEIGMFADQFSILIQEMERYTQEVARLAGEKERAATELKVAAGIQKQMLPGEIPDREEFSLYASMNPAKEVGGDFFDFYLIDDDHLALTIADVSGKGIPAALFMAVSKTILKNRTLLGGTPAQILADSNNQLCEGNERNMFVTVWLGILRLSTGQLICANAGHEYPAVRIGQAPFGLIKSRHGVALGAMENVRYRDECFQLAPGDAVFVYTDGVTEANNADQMLFSEERLSGVLEHIKKEDTPEMILETVRSAVDEFTGDTPQFDDLTMMCLVYRPGPR